MVSVCFLERGRGGRGGEEEKGTRKLILCFSFVFFSSSLHFSFPNSEEFRLMATLLAYLLGTFIDFFSSLIKNF